MKINLRFRHVLPILGVMATDRAFNEFVVPNGEDPSLVLYSYAITGFSLLLIATCFRYLSPVMRRWLLVTLAATAVLALESYNGWGTPMVYPTCLPSCWPCCPFSPCMPTTGAIRCRRAANGATAGGARYQPSIFPSRCPELVGVSRE
ncbi:hypothetical protein MUN84_19070 [Hymenobacter sp. 5516J-16]|uniref:hypothetical protein n=1 Tax=Hymenobacter sp. 5516J-16 TaxID=2932253 RepID=UPI001FCFB27A|nr:hypothetical protein [Hymenobacter sp. 5516J-16]UOQ76607.1 hypothetical protein MUN84_19070 [Hymenobacter sp. 5516J-16]